MLKQPSRDTAELTAAKGTFTNTDLQGNTWWSGEAAALKVKEHPFKMGTDYSIIWGFVFVIV